MDRKADGPEPDRRPIRIGEKVAVTEATRAFFDRGEKVDPAEFTRRLDALNAALGSTLPPREGDEMPADRRPA